MKNQYLFVLGRDPELSIIEIESLLETLNIDFEITDQNKSIAVISSEEINPNIINKLGGTIKIAKVISSSGRIPDIEENLEKEEFYMGTKNKAFYSVEGYQTGLTDLVTEIIKEYFKKIKVKGILKKDIEPSGMIKKDFLETGVSIVIFKNYIARTIALTNPLETKERDLSRPNVDYMKTISIRLAKILINLSQAKEGETLVDPFCGSGTLLQEALLKGINVIGIDKDPEAIKQSRENLEYIKNKYSIKMNYQLIRLDATKLSMAVREADAIVTEPYMGPYIRKLPTIAEAKNLSAELTRLYDAVINQASQILKKGKRIVIIIPRIRTRENKNVIISMDSIIEKTGLRKVYDPVLYAYQKSKLHREIYVLEKH